MGVFALDMRGRRFTAVLAAALFACIGTASAGAAKVYVGDGAKRNYSIALKTEAGRAYVLGLSALAGCQYDDEGEPVPPTFGLRAFPAPKRMRLRPRGYSAGETRGPPPGFTEARVVANFAGNRASGVYRLEYHEESINCETGYAGPAPFEARRYLPIGKPLAASPAPGETRVYYDHGGSTQFFARATPRSVVGLRGAIFTDCPVSRRSTLDRPVPLFPSPVGASLEAGRFDHRAQVRGVMWGSGAPYIETIEVSGREAGDVVIGTYVRVHVTRPYDGRPQRCVTGPLPIVARRYLPARGS